MNTIKEILSEIVSEFLKIIFAIFAHFLVVCVFVVLLAVGAHVVVFLLNCLGWVFEFIFPILGGEGLVE